MCAVAALSMGPVFAQALTVDEIQIQIKGLLAKIAELTAQMNALRNTEAISSPGASGGVSPMMPVLYHRVCGALSRTISVGSRGDDVQSLQEFLRGEGFLSANATGFFGSMTAQAVAKWQASQGVPSVGSVGPMTRERIKIWCGGTVENAQRFSATPTSGAGPLSVTFNTWLSAFRVNTISYTIDYGDGSSGKAADCYAPADGCLSPGQNSHTYTADGTYTATLNKITNTCPVGAQCFVGPLSEVVGKIQISVGMTSSCRPITYMPIACSDGSVAQPKHNEVGCITGYECPVANFTPSPSCKAWNDGCNTCSRNSPDTPAMCTLRACLIGQGFAAGKGYCSVYFDNSSSGNKPPVISGFSGPTTLDVNSTGTWSISAKDPESGQLNYQIWWGDEHAYAPVANLSGAMRDVVQNTTFTHAYSNSGTYTVAIVVRDSAGQEAKTSSTVSVGKTHIACTEQYDPVCGRPSGCANTCAPGMMCPAICQLYPSQTYSNRCFLNAAGAEFLYGGQCTSGGVAF